MTFCIKHLILVGQSEKNGRVDFWWAKEGGGALFLDSEWRQTIVHASLTYI